MYSVITIADEILKIAKAHGRQLTPLQLMKLAYIAQGWALALRDEKLFSNRVEAWKYGPVIPDLYHATKSYGRAPIPLDRISETPSSVDDGARKFLEDVFQKYGKMSGYSLSQLTHKLGTPWQQVYRDGVFGIEIPDSLIKNHYSDLLNARD
jgi:uncharacterized phage-associated protein